MKFHCYNKSRLMGAILLAAPVLFFKAYLLTYSALVWAQAPMSEDLKQLSQSGQLFTIRLQPGDKNLKIFLVGKEAAQIDLATAKLEVTLLDEQPGQRRVLRVLNQNDHFDVQDPLDNSKPNKLEIKARHKGKSETFHFELRNPRKN